MNEEVERLVSVTAPDGSVQALTTSTAHAIGFRQIAIGFIAVGFSQRTADANSFGLQPHILKMWLKPIQNLFIPLGIADSDPRLLYCRSESAAPTKRNSTVFHNKRSNRVIIDFSHEELAIRACDLLRFF